MKSSVQAKYDAIYAACHTFKRQCIVSLINGERYRVTAVLSNRGFSLTLDTLRGVLTVAPEDIVAVQVRT